MQHVTRKNEEARSSALWGKRSGSRGSALWGKGGRGLASFCLALVVVAGPAASVVEAKGKAPKHARQSQLELKAFVTPTLLKAARANPAKKFFVIVQGDGRENAADVERRVEKTQDGAPAPQVSKRFGLISGVSVKLSGKHILRLASSSHIRAITPDGPVELLNYSNKQKWAHVAAVARFWGAASTGTLKPPTIAVVDSGIEKNRSDFSNGARVIHEQVMTSLSTNSPGDGRGHGTFVAGIAAGSATSYAGVVPNAPLVSIDVLDDRGMARTSDVIAAAQWIHQNKTRFNIRVANFSLHSAVPNSFMFDPLNKAVEKLWFGGVVVVAAAGNHGNNGQPTGMGFAPANDPFVITVGANDIDGSVSVNDDSAAPWSAYGYTLDGFSKPDVAAPGRYIIGPVPATSTLALERPGQMRGVGYIELSGTSFAAPIVSGVAAYILAVKPHWTPDQVKGALMLTAKALPSAAPLSLGVGEINGPRAAEVVTPPNPNASLNAFLIADPTGDQTPVFDTASWARVAEENLSWDSASWARNFWETASWARDYWESASWARDHWESASWARDSQEAASWANASWASISYEDGADADPAVGGEFLTAEEEAALLAEAQQANESVPDG